MALKCKTKQQKEKQKKISGNKTRLHFRQKFIFFILEWITVSVISSEDESNGDVLIVLSRVMLNCGDGGFWVMHRLKILTGFAYRVHHFMLLILLLCYIFSYTLHLDLNFSYLEMWIQRLSVINSAVTLFFVVLGKMRLSNIITTEIRSFLKHKRCWCPSLHAVSQFASQFRCESVIVLWYLQDRTNSTVCMSLLKPED